MDLVQKPEDVEAKTLTVRARVREDMEALKARYLPELGAIQESAANDYRYRASATQAAVARAMALMIEHLDYNNFKNAVAQRQAQSRSTLYHDVWATLLPLQRQPMKEDKRAIAERPRRTQRATQPVVHPKPDDAGQSVIIRSPSEATALLSGQNPTAKRWLLLNCRFAFVVRQAGAVPADKAARPLGIPIVLVEQNLRHAIWLTTRYI